MKKTSKIYIIIIVALIIILAIETTYIVMQNIKVNNVEKQENSTNDSSEYGDTTTIDEDFNEEEIVLSENTYNVDDYVSFKDSNYSSNAKLIVFSNLPKRTISKFAIKNYSFEHSLLESFSWASSYYDASYANNYSNTYTYETYKNILSVSTVEALSSDSEYSAWSIYSYYSINIDLDTQKPINNKQLLNIFNVSIEDAYTKVLTDIATSATATKWYVSEIGVVTDVLSDDTITMEEFKQNISEYATYLNNDSESLTLYIKDGNLYCQYWYSDILNLIGLTAFDNVGYLKEIRTVQLN